MHDMRDSQTVYIETSVVSYLTARPTSSLLAAAWQKITADWWDADKTRFTICTSALTIEEAGRGDPDAAARRLAALEGVPLLPITDSVAELAKALLDGGALPKNALNDALHIGVSAVYGIRYLLTWNFRHLANAEARPVNRNVCEQQGFASPEICTPGELTVGRT